MSSSDGLRRWAAIVLLAGAVGAKAETARGPAGDWVEWLPVPALAAPGDSERVALLVDDQVSLLGGGRDAFFRRVTAVNASSGVSDASEFDISYAPDYESVVLHGAWVERGGRREDRLASARVDDLRRESGLESGLIDGVRTLHIVLDDVRSGDIVEFAVSVRGENPALAGQYHAYQGLQSSIPSRLRRFRVLHPAALDPPVRLVGVAQHERIERDGHVDQRWSVRDTQPRRAEQNEPAWHDAGPSVEFGGMRDWGAVVDWALPLYASAGDPAVAVLAKELGLARGDGSGKNVRRAIAFVQDEIRYTGLELGAHAFKPYPPAEVIRRRYGDCKDKANLLVGLLRHLGLRADPALVDVDQRAHVADRLPTPTAFDHVIVRFEHGGDDYWVDATNEQQRGALAHFTQADFGKALLIAKGEREPRAMTPPPGASPRVDIEEEFDLRDGNGGLSEDARYSIRTVYRGSAADAIRRRFASESAREIGESYVESIATYYPTLEMAAPPALQDDPERNEATVEESYKIGTVWQPLQESDDDERTQASFWLTEIDRALPTAKRMARSSPLALGPPIDLRQKLTVRLDKGWPTDDDDTVIDGEHFDFSRKIRHDGSVLVIEGRVTTQARDVAAADVPRLAADLARAQDELGYELTLGGPSADPAGVAGAATWIDWRLIPIAFVVLATWAFVTWCGLSRSTSPWLGMWFRPRATVRAALAGKSEGAVVALIVLGVVTQLLADPSAFAGIGNRAAMLGAILAASVLGGLFAAIFYFIYAAAIAWSGRLLGGTAPVMDVWTGMGLAQAPWVAAAPALAALLLAFGPQDSANGDLVAVVGLALVGFLVVVPLAIWSFLAWFPVLSEVQGFSVRRAVVNSLLPLLVVLAVVALVIGGVRLLSG